MYKITCDNFTVFETGNPTLKGFNFTLERGINTAGTINCTIAKEHPRYDNVGANSVIRCYVDGVQKFIGEVTATSIDIYGSKKFTCLGILAKFAQTYQPYDSGTNYTVNGYIDWLLEHHNEQIGDKWAITRGTITVTDPNDNLYRVSNYDCTKDCISDKLLSSVGGYMTATEGEDGFLFNLVASGKLNNQPISFGQNITNALIEANQALVYNVILPLGAKTGNTEERLTIASVNDGSMTVEDEDSIEAFGRRVLRVLYDDVTEASNLKTKAYADLNANKFLLQAMKINAIDLSKLGLSYNQIDPSDTIQLVVPHLGIDTWALVQTVFDDGSTPSNSYVVLGATQKTMTDSKLQSDKVINSIVANYVTGQTVADKISGNNNDIVYPLVEQNASLIDQAANEILQSVGQSYVSNDQLESYNESIQSQVADQIEFKFLSVNDSISSVEDVIGNNQSLLEEYIRFRGALIELGKTTSNFTAEFDNESLRFLENGQVIAYISNNKLYIKNAEITNSLSISYYQFQIAPDSGAVSLFYTG